MADNILGNLGYKSIASSVPRSANDKEDFIKERLRRLEIAYSVMAKYPEILNEYVCAVKGGCNLPATEPTAPVLKNQNVLSQSIT